MEKLAKQTLQDADLEVIRSSLTILQEMQEVAEYIEDMQSEISVEITQSCVSMRRRMAKIVEAKSMMSQIQPSANEIETIEQITLYLEMIDFIDNCLQSYKNKYQQLKEKKLITIQKQKSKLQSEAEDLKKKESKKEEKKKRMDDSDSDKEDKPKKLDDDSESSDEVNADPQSAPNQEQPQTSLLELDSEPQEPKSEVKEEEKVQAEPVKKGFGLKAPPKNTQHVLTNIRNLNKKLEDADPKQEEQKGDAGDIMDMLMDIDFTNKGGGQSKPQK